VGIDFRRWGVFNFVGLCGFAVQIGVIALLTRSLGWSPVAATALALELAALQNFLGHSAFTWHERRAPTARRWIGRFWRYQIAKTASLLANLGITAALVIAGLPPEIANTSAVVLCAVPNYLLSEHFVFALQDRS
jgi:putative flippase GtrA